MEVAAVRCTTGVARTRWDAATPHDVFLLYAQGNREVIGPRGQCETEFRKQISHMKASRIQQRPDGSWMRTLLGMFMRIERGHLLPVSLRRCAEGAQSFLNASVMRHCRSSPTPMGPLFTPTRCWRWLSHLRRKRARPFSMGLASGVLANTRGAQQAHDI